MTTFCGVEAHTNFNEGLSCRYMAVHLGTFLNFKGVCRGETPVNFSEVLSRRCMTIHFGTFFKLKEFAGVRAPLTLAKA
jgi:hypothetical protein